MDLGVRGTGCALWEASIVLAGYLEKNPACVRGHRVLELGAGLGLISQVLDSTLCPHQSAYTPVFSATPSPSTPPWSLIFDRKRI